MRCKERGESVRRGEGEEASAPLLPPLGLLQRPRTHLITPPAVEPPSIKGGGGKGGGAEIVPQKVFIVYILV